MRGLSVLAGTSALACVFGLAALALRADEPAQEQDWRKLIVSEDEAARRGAADLVLQDREATTAQLIQVLESPAEKGEGFYQRDTPRNTAIRLLGELRAPQAVRPLTERLMPMPGQSTGDAGLEDMLLTPAGWALVEIGMPAVPAAVDILAFTGVSSEDKRTKVRDPDGMRVRFVGPPLERSSPVGDQCLRILVYIKGLEETEAGLRRHIAGETDAARKKNLEGALEALSRPSLRQGFEAFQAQKEARERGDWAGFGQAMQAEETARLEARRMAEAARKAALGAAKTKTEEKAQPAPEPPPASASEPPKG